MKTPLLADVYAVEAFQTHGHQMVDLLAKHLKAAQKATRKTIPYTDPEIEKNSGNNIQKSKISKP